MLQAEAYKSNKNLRLLTFSYLSGSDLYHKVAVLDKKTRELLPHAGLLDQKKVLEMKSKPKKDAVKYALSMVDSFRLKDTLSKVVSVSCNH